jgi:uncharacterized protein YndB with AHSA1/START domain
MAKIALTASAIVPAPPERTWELISDTSRYAEWVAATEAVTRTDGPARHGSTYAEVNPILGPWKAKTSWTVVEFDPPHLQVHRTTDIQIASEFLVIMEVKPKGDASQITITLRASSSLGFLGGALFAALKAQTRRDNQTTVNNLAELARRETHT